MKRKLKQNGFVFFLLAAVISFAVTSGFAQEEEEEVIPLEEIEITSPRIETKIEDVPGSVTVITREEIEKSNAYKVGDLLKNVTAAQFMDEAGSGNTQNIALRAYDAWRSQETKILINGVPVRSAFNIPIEPVSIERIEVMRGPSATIYGTRTGGGVINIVTREGSEKFRIEPSFSAGAWGLQKYSLFVGGTSGRLNYHVSSLYRKGDGFRVRNSKFETIGYAARLVHKLDERSRLSLNTEYWNSDKEWPAGLGTFEEIKEDSTAVTTHPSSRWPQRAFYGNVAYEGYFNGGHSVALNLFYGLNDRRQTLDLTAPGAKKPRMITQVRDRHNLGLFARYRNESEIRGRQSAFLAGVTVEWDDFNNIHFEVAPDGIAKEAPRADTETGNLQTAVYVLEEFYPTDTFKVAAGLRYHRVGYFLYDNLKPGRLYQPDTDNGTFGATSSDIFIPALGVELELSKEIGLYGNIVRTFRPPSARTLIDPFLGNPDLKPAKSLKYEVGANIRHANFLSFTLAGYIDAFKDDILRVETGFGEAQTYQYQNAGETDRKGVEGSVVISLAEMSEPLSGLSLFANGAIQGGEFSAHPTLKGKGLPFIPERLFNVGVRYDSPVGLGFSLTGNHVGEKWGDNKNTFKVPGYTVLNAMVSYESRFLSAFVKVNNLTDERYAVHYKPSFGGYLPGAPRNVEAGVTYKY